MSKVHIDKLRRAVVAASLVGAVLFAETAFSAQPVFEGAEVVEFGSAAFTHTPSPFRVKRAKKLGIALESTIEPSVPLTGYLARPVGEGPFPAVVLMHGCNGIWEWDKVWTDRLVAWDYVVLNVDSLTPRGFTDICHGRDTITATPWIRALDAYGAMNHLATLRYVDPMRIAVVGMSLGGTAVLYTIEQSMTGGLQTKPFRAAVALYPSCRELQQVNTPTLILIGDKDNWTPASWCVRYLDQLKPPHDVTVKVFPGAHHIFDLEGLDAEEGGLTIRHHPQAAAEAIEMIKMFLKDRL